MSIMETAEVVVVEAIPADINLESINNENGNCCARRTVCNSNSN